MPNIFPKLNGADLELANFITGAPNLRDNNGAVAARLLLARIAGLPINPRPTSVCNCEACRRRRQREQEALERNGGRGNGMVSGDNPQDIGRRFLLQNGGCAYIDLNHLEVCLPEVIDAFSHVAYSHAMFRLAQQACEAVNAELPAGARAHVLANNSDGQGNSYGTHLNVLMARRAYDDLFHRRLHLLLHLATYQVASLVLTGQGKVGSENGAPPVDYQISQRADYFETLVGLQTTFRRPIVNSRDESLTGWQPTGSHYHDSNPFARLHVIFYDNNLCHVASVLKIGLLQIEVAMIEAGCTDTAYLLDDPLEAVLVYSHDPHLLAAARLTSGEEITLVDLLRRLLDKMEAFEARGGCAGIVPRAGEILALARDTIEKLARREYDSVAGRIDWVLKWQMLQSARARRPNLDWDSPPMKQLDHMYAHLDPGVGLFYAKLQDGQVERLVSEEQIARCLEEPPADTRAYGRAMLLRRGGNEAVQSVDWDRISLKITTPGRSPGYTFTSYRTLEMDNPLDFTQELVGSLFDDMEMGLGDLIAALESHEHDEVVARRQEGAGPADVATPAEVEPAAAASQNVEPADAAPAEGEAT
jgi:proteasome accessory factor A